MKNNYTLEHPNYIVPSLEQITNELEVCGYKGFFPYEIFSEILNLCVHHSLEGDFKYGYLPFSCGPDDIIKKYKALFDSLQFDFYCSLKMPPTVTAIAILKDLSEKVNLRKLEGYKGDFEIKQGDVSNPEYEITESDEEFFSDLASDETLFIDLQRILKLVAYLNTKLPVKKSGEEVRKVQTHLKKLGDIMKAKRSEMVKPTFIVDVLMKKLPIVETIPDSTENEVLVYLEDASSSMMNNQGYLVSRAMQKLLLEDPRKVHYYRYAGDQIQSYILNTAEEKLECFTREHPYYKKDCDYKLLFNTVLKQYNGGNVFIVTDAQDSVPKSFQTGMSIYCLDASEGNNVSMKALCKSTNGKYLTL